MSLLIAAILFAVFFGNVVMGAFLGTPFLTDIGEMLMLLAASVAFVVAILKKEREAATKKST